MKKPPTAAFFVRPNGRGACTFLFGVKEKYQKKHAKKVTLTARGTL